MHAAQWVVILRSGALGFAAGLALLTAALLFAAPENLGTAALLLPAVTFVLGLIKGLVQARRSE